MAEAMRGTVAAMLRGIDRYNPENLATLERYVEVQAKDNAYDLEANLAVLKLYEFNPNLYKLPITCQILLKALTNLPHTDFILCKCLLAQERLEDAKVQRIMFLADLLEMCQFQHFWREVQGGSGSTGAPAVVVEAPVTAGITGFEDSIRKFVCHVVSITYQTIDKGLLSQLLGDVDEITLQMWVRKYGWKIVDSSIVYISNQEESVKTKNITEKIDFESVAAIMAASR